ncbi:MAG: WecB/TagA/CpsF family glycosyltransferase [Pseudomonadota bacterium]|nr:WecB/TagA/CpsF family glycosyltransferase [Pseudomonadota bacterium]
MSGNKTRTIGATIVLSPFPVERSRRAEFLGCPVDLYDRRESLALIASAIEKRQRLQHVVVNVAKLVSMRRDEALRRDVAESDLINIDGMGVVWGARLLGLQVSERVAGADLMMDVLALCEQRGFRPYFFGARPEVLDRFIVRVRELHPGLDIAGWHHGYFSRDEEDGIASDIRDAKPDCLFIAISSPIKERFLHAYRDDLDVPFLMGVGGTIDVVAGVVSRAPLWMQKAGLEWLFRLAQEPRRMWRRYLTTNAEYAVLMIRALLVRQMPDASGCSKVRP